MYSAEGNPFPHWNEPAGQAQVIGQNQAAAMSARSVARSTVRKKSSRWRNITHQMWPRLALSGDGDTHLVC